MLADHTAGSDDFLREVDAALTAKYKRAWQCIAVSILTATTLSLCTFLFHASGEPHGWRWWLTGLPREWAHWSHGWASAAEVNVTVIGLLTAALTLYVATALQPVDPDISTSGAASRMLLDGITLVACFAGATAAWVLAAGAGWHRETGLAWAPAAASALLLSVLAVSTEGRRLTREQSRWSLQRAQRDLRDAIGDRPCPSRVRAFPWLRLTALTVVVVIPSAVGLVLNHPRDLGTLAGVAILTAMIAVVWFVLIGALWNSAAKIAALRVRYRRWYASDLLASYLGDAFLVGIVGFLAWAVAAWWGVACLIPPVLLGLAAQRHPLAPGLQGRQLYRQLRAVDGELASLLPLLDEPAPEPGQAPWRPEDRDLAWSVELGGLRILRFRSKPRPG